MTVTLPEMRVQPENPLWDTFTRINNDVDTAQRDFRADRSEELARALNVKLRELNDFVADMFGAGLVDFDQAAEMCRRQDWVHVNNQS